MHTDTRGAGTRGAYVLGAWTMVLMVVMAVAGFDPWGWDSSGPLRWMVLPTLVFLAVAAEAARKARWVGEVDGHSAVGSLSERSSERRWDWLVEDPLLVTLALLLGVGVVSALAATDPWHAWVGTPDRRLGWVTWLMFTSAYWVGRQLAQETRPVAGSQSSSGLVSWALVASGVGLAAFGVVDWFLAVSVSFAGGRWSGPLGQPAYLGAATVLVLPVALAVMFGENGALDGSKQAPSSGVVASLVTRHGVAGRAVQGAAGVAVVSAVACLVGSQSRAAWLGAVVGIGVWLVARARCFARQPSEELLVGAGVRSRTAAAIVGGAGVLVVGIPTVRSRIGASFGERGVIAGRVDEWLVGWRALWDSPWWGYGPEGYRTVFGHHVDEQYVMKWGRDVITDRAHSGPLDVALSFGVLGGALYLAALVLVARRALWGMRQRDATTQGWAVAVLAYGVAQLALFPLAELDVVFWLVTGLLTGTHIRTTGDVGSSDASGGGISDPGLAKSGELATILVANSPQNAPDGSPGGGIVAFRRNWANWIVVGTALGLAAALGTMGTLDLVANIRLNRALRSTTPEAVGEETANVADKPAVGDEQEPFSEPAAGDEQLRLVDSAVSLRPDSIRYRFVAARLHTRAGRIDEALAMIDAGLQVSSRDPALQAEQARILLVKAAQAPEGDDNKAALVDAAIAALESLVSDDPFHPEHLRWLSDSYRLQGRDELAAAAARAATQLSPDGG